jgi:hypothetical protein
MGVPCVRLSGNWGVFTKIPTQGLPMDRVGKENGDRKAI